ncbi:beta-ketoacyl-ACP synthase [Leptolyngbya sp. FACHB-671]|uniref:beta-ketoacyl-ACP synthase n=1 Tax=Leptolyngbya sp. FACHB-671 TaxID=2692812 RepID=UPI00168A0849|nr:beta-ketoacyl-ACP synthase [Leptolyngbya sp. FACHB-671]
MEVVVTGIGLVSALGNLEQTWRRSLSKKTAICLQQPFPELAPRPLALIGNSPSALLPLVRVASAALQDAGLELPLTDCGIVVGSSRGQQAQWEKLTRSKQDGIENWLETLPNAAAIATAHQVGAVGPVLSPMAACATGLWAIAQAFELIQTGQCERAIAGAVEAPITPLTLAGFTQVGALAQTGAYPFDRYREGLALGEGGAVFVLETAESAKKRAAKVYGRILGFGLTADGYHVSAPDPDGREGAIAIKQCLERSGLTPEAIGYIHAHGTATQLNDRNEARLIQRIFPKGVPVSSTKGSTGHTLGASGALGIAFCLMALKHQILPPCVGLSQPEFALDLVIEPRRVTIQNALCLSFGFGGQNAAIALGC